ncbi:high frequency lysogenization protein HflD [Pseudoalteromonas sp. MM17-2]|uniref:high frequency lysogenization protein HflD n=1 Tax=Pseudoalteromonas sp. MM17-2 TaxID=2917753 RepID=UPI001EF4CC14|nr:high frequency lysogenization protein HflD [Pseudoalteromonas sp. MM17-2]MCG7544677.1 high frequency lysogenization protein HflD [Pseudoalteromonas sp. MM17-2]
MNANQIMALAAMCQVAIQVQKLAKYGQAQQSDIEPLLNSLVVTDPDNVEDVYGSRRELYSGYRALVAQLSAGTEKNVELVKYVGGLIQLERILASKPEALNKLGSEIQTTKNKLTHLELMDESIIAAFAETYATVISPLGQRIQVFGQPQLLKQSSIQSRIRALLLAGIRAAVLWRQLGGKRRHFIFAKRKMLALAKEQL